MNRIPAKRDPVIVITGSCQNFEKERSKIIKFIGDLELGAKTKVEYQCYSTGISMGWEFFELCLDPDLVYSLFSIFPDMKKEEGTMAEQQFVHWLSKQFKKRKLEYYLKLNDVPREKVSGFRLDPNKYRDDSLLEEWR
ncbi:MAG: hypothetical protein ACM3X1_03515 [Ignavibacteriales bacterium]